MQKQGGNGGKSHHWTEKNENFVNLYMSSLYSLYQNSWKFEQKCDEYYLFLLEIKQKH